MKIVRPFLLLLAAAIFVSCTGTLPPLVSWARFAKPVDPSVEVSTNAILYGRFAAEHHFSFGNRLALRVHNETAKEDYLIALKDTNSVYGIAVKPGKYRITGYVATFGDRRVAGLRTLVNSPLFDVHSNMITYIGDFRGYARMNGTDQEWNISSVTNNFVPTTAQFRTEHPHLIAKYGFNIFEDK